MWCSDWNEVFRKHEWGKYPAIEVVRFIARNFYQVSNKSSVDILEVGCGTGANLWYVVREGFAAAGIDGSQIAIDRFRKRIETEHLKCELHVGDAAHLPFDSNRFDGIIDYECLYSNSMKDAQLILKEIFRVLKPGGKFFSATFMTGTHGDGLGKKMPGEDNTYIELYEGGIRNDCGVVRFTSESDIQKLYGAFFEIENIDYSIRSEKNRKFEIREWLITCIKK